jgi:hypothetical protein
VGVGAATTACGVVIALSPSLTWFRGTASAPGSWTGFGLHADRVALGIHGNAVMMGFEADGWYSSMFGPLVPVLVGLALCLGGLAVLLRWPGPSPAWAGRWSVVIALWSLGAAGVTGGAGVDPGGGVGGPGIRVWAIGSTTAAIGLAVLLAHEGSTTPSSVADGRVIDWVSIPAILLGGVFAAVLARTEEWHPFATAIVFIAATLTAACPAIGTVAALLAAAPPRRPLAVTVVNAAALVLGVLLFVLWAQVALE